MTIPQMTNRVRGEYRARLYDFRGKLKHDSGWRPNMVLDQGPWFMIGGISNALNVMCLGDSDTAAVSTQTGLQGTRLGGVGGVYLGGTGGANWSTPPYYYYVQQPYVFGLGVGTGTIKEFVMCPGNDDSNATTYASIRVVLDTPIVKTSTDQLTMEWRLYMYPETAVQSGVLDCSGVSYDWELGWYNIDELMYGQTSPAGLISSFVGSPRSSFGSPANGLFLNGVMPADIFSMPTGDAVSPSGAWRDASSAVTNGSPPYNTITLSADVDYMNTTFDMTYIYHNHYPYTVKSTGRVIKILRTSDGNPFVKANTHEITLRYRLFLDKYVP